METIDEIIFRTTKVRNRLILELMARVGMRIDEVLKLTPKDVSDLKLTIHSPKRGKDAEVVFIPRKMAEGLRAYLKERAVEPENRIFPITYAAAGIVVKKAGRIAGIELRPHDLSTAPHKSVSNFYPSCPRIMVTLFCGAVHGRHAATYASRSGVPIGIVSKVILRHANLSTTQRYFGKISDTEATR